MRVPGRLLLLALLLPVAACGDDSPTTPATSSGPYSQTDLVVGTGAAAVATSTVTVSYTGWLYDTSKTDGKGAPVREQPKRDVSPEQSHRGVAAGRRRDEGRRTAPADHPARSRVRQLGKRS